MKNNNLFALKETRQKIFAILTVAALAYANTGMYAAVSADTYDDEQKAKLINELSAKEQRGDINGDGIINVFDVMRYKNTIIESKKFDTDSHLYRLDVNDDEFVNGTDISAVKNDILKKSKIWSYKSTPKMDGSTSAIPLETGLKSKMLGVSYVDAKKLVEHHKTHESFDMLLSGENDMIFTVPISEEQQKAADDAGVKLNFVPVAKEGFVFVVNKNNPVDSLTQEQIRDIYSGKITNWKELGGNDEKIVPYQRNKDSGSQNYMTEFMKNSELMDPPQTYVLGSMSALMSGIAVYDNAENAIGYSVYSYAAQMYENSAETKFVAIDGIKPTRETMADGTYPLLSSTYIVYTDKASQNTRDFAAWAVSEEGQECVLASGYVPVKDMEYPENYKPYSAKGTGKAKPSDYQPAKKYSLFGKYARPDSTTGNINKENYCVDFLKDKDFQKTVNDDISSVLARVDTHSELEMHVEVINGYMNVQLEQPDVYDSNRISKKGWIVNFNYDLRNSRKMDKFSDLFYKDEEFVENVNTELGNLINRGGNSGEFSRNYASCLKTDFLGLTGNADNFSFDKIVLDESGPYFDRTYNLKYNNDNVLTDSMVIGEYFDNNQVLDDGNNASDLSYNEWVEHQEERDDGEVHTYFTSRIHSKEEVDAKNALYEKIFAQAKELRAKDPYVLNSLEYYKEHYPDEKKDISDFTIKIFRLGGDDNSSKFYTFVNVYTAHFGKTEVWEGPYMFDPETAERVKITDILGKSFEKYDNARQWISSINLDTGTVVIEGPERLEEKIVFADLNMKYISPRVTDGTEVVKLDSPVSGTALGGETEGLYGYASSYIINGGEEKKEWPIEGNWNIVAKNCCYSHGDCWYECWDADDGDYYGWIRSENLALAYEFEFEKKCVAMGGKDKNVFGYKTDYVVGYGKEEKQWPIEGEWNVTAKRRCSSHGELWYECYDRDDGDYYGWIKVSDLSFK